MKISVIIATYFRRDDLRRTINAFKEQTYPEKEIIVVDNASTDGTLEMMANEFPDIKYLWLPDNIDMKAINYGISLCDGDVIWRTDDDSFPEDKDCFHKISAIFRDFPSIDIIATENIEVNDNNKIYNWYPYPIDKINVPADGYISHYFNGSGAAIRRKVFDKIGGFWDWGFEELDFCTRAIMNDFNIRYYPNIKVLHYSGVASKKNPVRWLKLSRQYIRYQWRYFPFWQATGRSLVVFNSQILNGIMMKMPLSAIFECFFTMNATIFSTYRNERNIIPKNKIKDITLGISLFKAQFTYYKNVVKRKMIKWKKN